jgi:hypothetical protein
MLARKSLQIHLHSHQKQRNHNTTFHDLASSKSFLKGARCKKMTAVGFEPTPRRTADGCKRKPKRSGLDHSPKPSLEFSN